MADSPVMSLSLLRTGISEIRSRALTFLRNWLESTENLIHIVILLLVPVLLAFITWISNITPFVTFLVYPPLASGTYTLFADPEGKYSSPRKFVGGMTFGALCGWVSLEVTALYWYAVPPEQFEVHAGATALSIFLTGLGTWILDLEEPTAFSAALLALVTGSNQIIYVLGIAVSSSIVAGAFTLWKRQIYEQRADYLFQTVQSDDRVLVPIRYEDDDETALFAAYIAAAHTAGKVVLYMAIHPDDISDDVVADEEGPDRTGSWRFDTGPETNTPHPALPSDRIERLQEIEASIEETVDVPCEMVVVRADPDDPRIVTETAEAVECDLIVSQYRPGTEDARSQDGFVPGLFQKGIDVIGFHTTGHKTSWSRILVLVKNPGTNAHAMIDFARRLAPTPTNVSLCRCIQDTSERSEAEDMLRDIVSSFKTGFETRVAYADVKSFLARNAKYYDLTIIGASSERGTASKVLSPPTFETLEEIDSDVAVIHKS